MAPGGAGPCYHQSVTDMLDVRIAHLEGAYEQIDKRLGGVESALGQLRSEMGQLRSELRSEMYQGRSELTARMDSQFRWLLGTILSTWVTLLLAVFFRS